MLPESHSVKPNTVVEAKDNLEIEQNLSNISEKRKVVDETNPLSNKKQKKNFFKPQYTSKTRTNSNSMNKNDIITKQKLREVNQDNRAVTNQQPAYHGHNSGSVTYQQINSHDENSRGAINQEEKYHNKNIYQNKNSSDKGTHQNPISCDDDSISVTKIQNNHPDNNNRRQRISRGPNADPRANKQKYRSGNYNHQKSVSRGNDTDFVTNNQKNHRDNDYGLLSNKKESHSGSYNHQKSVSRGNDTDFVTNSQKNHRDNDYGLLSNKKESHRSSYIHQKSVSRTTDFVQKNHRDKHSVLMYKKDIHRGNHSNQKSVSRDTEFVNNQENHRDNDFALMSSKKDSYSSTYSHQKSKSRDIDSVNNQENHHENDFVLMSNKKDNHHGSYNHQKSVLRDTDFVNNQKNHLTNDFVNQKNHLANDFVLMSDKKDNYSSSYSHQKSVSHDIDFVNNQKNHRDHDFVLMSNKKDNYRGNYNDQKSVSRDTKFVTNNHCGNITAQKPMSHGNDCGSKANNQNKDPHKKIDVVSGQQAFTNTKRNTNLISKTNDIIEIFEEDESNNSPIKDSEAILQHDRIILNKKDLECLKGNAWLNDNIVDFYLSILKKSETKSEVHIFNSQLFSKLRKVRDSKAKEKNYYKESSGWFKEKEFNFKKIWLIPVCDKNHWYLIAVNRARSNKPVVCVFNSLNTNTEQSVNLVKELLKERYMAEHGNKLNEVVTKYINIPAQDNSYDCGLHLIRSIELFFEEDPILFVQNIMKSSIDRTDEIFIKIKVKSRAEILQVISNYSV